MRRFIFVTVTAVVLAFPALGVATADAQSASAYIRCGLQAGASLDISLNRQCLANAAGSSQPVASSQTTVSPVLTPVATTQGITGTYVALGDSVAAGLGLAGSSSDVPCGRSSQAYPTIVAQRLGLPLTTLACRGATVGDLVTQQHVVGPNPPAQLNGAFAAGTPQLITITAGANDAHWAGFIRACYITNCARESYTTAANAYLTLLQAKLYYALTSIQARSGDSPPQVLLTGYYNPLSQSCAAQQTAVSSAELSWIQQETDKLNTTLQNVTSHYSFVRFVPISFTGHDICSPSPWVQGVNDPAPFHPTATGQQAIASAILSAVQ